MYVNIFIFLKIQLFRYLQIKTNFHFFFSVNVDFYIIKLNLMNLFHKKYNRNLYFEDLELKSNSKNIQSSETKCCATHIVDLAKVLVVVASESSRICCISLEKTIPDLGSNILNSTRSMWNENSIGFGGCTNVLHCVKVLGYENHIHDIL